MKVIICSLAASIIPKWRPFKFLSWVHLLNRLVNLDKILYGRDDIEDHLEHYKMEDV
jgi:hypothetical protein